MYYSINDATYWYEIHGQGVPIVMLHGFTGSGSTWKHFITKWKNDLQIITIDLPGHGKTTTPSLKSMEQCCQDLMHLFDHLNLETFHLLGYSMGGRTALSLSMLHPERVQSLILESASPGLETEDERNERVDKDEKLAIRIEAEGVPAFINFWEDLPLFHSQKSLPKEVQNTIRMERIAQSGQGLTQSLRFMGTGTQPSWWNDLGQFAKPVLLLVGADDHKFIKINKTMQNRFPNSHMEIIEHAGHAIHVEQPEIFGRIVKSYIFSLE